MAIGAAEFKKKTDEITVASEGGGAPAQNQCVAQCASAGLRQLNMKNMGAEAITYEVLARGLDTTITAEDVSGLQVGVTDQFQGLLANRRIVAGTFTCTDAGGATQAVVDDGNGNIVDATALTTIVGSINYETGAIDFTWMAAFVGAGVTADYHHVGWLSFAAPITGTVVAGGGEGIVVLLPTGGDNFIDGIKGNYLVGIMAHSPGQGSALKVQAIHVGDDVAFKLVRPARFRNLNSPLTEV